LGRVSSLERLLMTKLQQLEKRRKEIQIEDGKIRQAWEREKLKSVKHELKDLIGKCFYTRHETDGRESEAYYKVLSATPNYSCKDNHNLVCLEVSVNDGYYKNKVYQIDTHICIYQSIISKNEISKEEFEQRFSDIILELEELNV
jgi:hypothetical protein